MQKKKTTSMSIDTDNQDVYFITTTKLSIKEMT